MNSEFLTRQLGSHSGAPVIVEVGFDLETCMGIAAFVRERPARFTSVGLNMHALTTAHDRLDEHDLASYAAFLLQDPGKYLSTLTWVDAVFLDLDATLDGGRALYRLAASAGAGVIVFKHYQMFAAAAIREARDNGWFYSTENEYYILRRA
jgi:tRNA A58 N-methylase Trm61